MEFGFIAEILIIPGMHIHTNKILAVKFNDFPTKKKTN